MSPRNILIHIKYIPVAASQTEESLENRSSLHSSEAKNPRGSSSLSGVNENSTCNSEDPETSSSSDSRDPEALCGSHSELFATFCSYLLKCI